MAGLYYFSISFASFWQSMIDWLESHMGTCIYKKYFGVECPGCGMQRSFIELLKGNFIESLVMYPALLPSLFLLIYLPLHLIFKFKNGALVLKISFIFTAAIIVINYVIKMLT